MQTEQAIEMLRCALVNCDNIKKVGPVMIDIVKSQIEEALRLIDSEEPTQEALDNVPM